MLVLVFNRSWWRFARWQELKVPPRSICVKHVSDLEEVFLMPASLEIRTLSGASRDRVAADRAT